MADPHQLAKNHIASKIRKIQRDIEDLILIIPSSELRNAVCDANIAMMKANDLAEADKT